MSRPDHVTLPPSPPYSLPSFLSSFFSVSFSFSPSDVSPTFCLLTYKTVISLNSYCIFVTQAFLLRPPSLPSFLLSATTSLRLSSAWLSRHAPRICRCLSLAGRRAFYKSFLGAESVPPSVTPLCLEGEEERRECFFFTFSFFFSVVFLRLLLLLVNYFCISLFLHLSIYLYIYLTNKLTIFYCIYSNYSSMCSFTPSPLPSPLLHPMQLFHPPLVHLPNLPNSQFLSLTHPFIHHPLIASHIPPHPPSSLSHLPLLKIHMVTPSPIHLHAQPVILTPSPPNSSLSRLYSSTFASISLPLPTHFLVPLTSPFHFPFYPLFLPSHPSQPLLSSLPPSLSLSSTQGAHSPPHSGWKE